MIFNKPYRVVLIDDDPDMLDLLRNYLDRIDSNEVTFSSFVDHREAMAYIENHEVHIVITDLNLEKASGTNIISECIDLQRGIQVIALSADTRVMTALECFSRGARYFLDKPVDRDLFTNIVNDCIKFLDRWHDLVKRRLHK